jgi:hypothetical protein
MFLAKSMQFQRDQQRDYSLTTVPCIGILKPPKMPEKLQDDLEQLQKWERDWLMEFQPKKCQVTNITSKRNIIRHHSS